MRLGKDPVSRLSDDTTVVTLNPRDQIEQAIALARDGWHVFPLRPNTKIPLFPRAHPRGVKCHGDCGEDGHGAYDGTTDVNRIARWWTENPRAGIGANLGPDRLVIDIDVYRGGQEPPHLPTHTRTHLSGRGDGSRHLVYKYTPGSLASGLASNANSLGTGVDVKIGYGSYVVMPPTLHEQTGEPYTVQDPTVVEHLLTDEEIRQVCESLGIPAPTAAEPATRPSGVKRGGLRLVETNLTPVSMLSDLLQNPPIEGGRNEWLAKVAGHYAKQYRHAQDLYQVHVERAAELTSPPLEAHEVHKVLHSIWGSEEATHSEREATPNTGWLTGDGDRIYCQITVKRDDETVYDIAEWGDFDLRAEGVTVDDSGARNWWVKLHHNGTERDLVLDPAVLSDDRKLKTWLATYGASWDTPINAFPKTAPSTRLLRYLQSQNPTVVVITPTLGYQDRVFVTHEGVIDPKGFHHRNEVGVMADPGLKTKNTAPYYYGFESTRQEALAVLEQVLTYQSPEAVSLFASWWSACLLKPQLHEVSSLFPIFGVEAASESGKTTGFFDLMTQLNGNTRGHTAPTRPVLRDMASSNRNGIVWVDDLDTLAPYEELLRASTTNGTVAKMHNSNERVQSNQIVAPILVSGESLGLSDQKALADRTVQIQVSSPKDRRTASGILQWDEIVELQSRYPRESGGLSVLAGWYVVEALKHAPRVLDAVGRAKDRMSGRHGDKHAVLIAGAQLLDSMLAGEWTTEGEHHKRVADWVRLSEASRLDHDNTLTMTVLPWAVQRFQAPEELTEISTGKHAGQVSPVVVRVTPAGVPQVWFSATLLAQSWKHENNGRVSPRTESVEAFRHQLKAIRNDVGESESRAMRVRGGSGKTVVKMTRLPTRYTRVVLERSGLRIEGDTGEDPLLDTE